MTLYIDPMIRIKCWVSFQEETKLRLTELIVYFIGGIVCQDDKLGVCVQQPSKCHIKCVKTDSRGCKPGTIKRDFTPIWFVSACGMSAKLLPLIELTPGEWENGINGHNVHYASEQSWLSEVCVKCYHSALTSTGCSEKLTSKTKHIPALFGARQVDSTKKSNTKIGPFLR